MIVLDRKPGIALFAFACTMLLARLTAPVHVPRLVIHRHTRTETLPEVQLMADMDCESRWVGAGVRRGFQYDVALSGNGNSTFLKVLFMNQRRTKTSGR